MVNFGQIFVLDDDEEDLFLLQAAFHAAALDAVRLACFTTLEDLEAAIDAHQVPDIIITDYRLPRSSGLEVISRVRSKPIPSQPKILVWSSEVAPEELDSCLQAGADGALPKPATYPDLVQTVAALTGQWL